MSLMTTVYLLERYGPRLGMEQIAEVLGMSTGTLHNRVYRGQIELATYMDGGKRYADVRDLAAYLDQMRGRAASRAEQSRGAVWLNHAVLRVCVSRDVSLTKE